MVYLTVGARSLAPTTLKTILDSLAQGTDEHFLVVVQKNARSWLPNNLLVQILKYSSANSNISKVMEARTRLPLVGRMPALELENSPCLTCCETSGGFCEQHQDQVPTLAKLFPAQAEFAMDNAFAAVFFGDCSQTEESNLLTSAGRVPEGLWNLVRGCSEFRFVLEPSDAQTDWSMFHMHLNRLLASRMPTGHPRGREERKTAGGRSPRWQIAQRMLPRVGTDEDSSEDSSDDENDEPVV